MQEFSSTLLKNLESNLKFIHAESDETIKQAEASIVVCRNAFNKLKQFTLKYKFPSEKEEIAFFKEIKPKFAGLLIYYVELFNVEYKQHNGNQHAQRQALQRELDNLKSYIDNNLDFYRYYRMRSTHLDNKYFVRGDHDIHLYLDSYVFETDPKFSTNCDHRISRIIANDLLSIYLNAKLVSIDRKENTTPIRVIGNPPTKFTWTGSKASLVELIYALHSTGCFNNGATSIKDIVSFFENTFNIDLNHFYTIYQEIKERKGHHAMFLRSLQDGLQRRIAEQDEKR